MKLGAYDYVGKPLNGTELLPLLGTAAEAARRQSTSPPPTGAPEPSTLIVGTSRGMQAVYKKIGRLAARPLPHAIVDTPIQRLAYGRLAEASFSPPRAG